MPTVNNVTRFLDSRKVFYETFEYPPDKLSALEVAHLLDVAPDSVFKTIVVTRDKPRKPLLVLVPGPSSVNLKLLASSIGEKKVYLPTEREAEQLTGLQAGGISPLALLHKSFPVYIDRPALELERVLVSAGKRGVNLELPVEDLLRVTKKLPAS